MPLTDPDQWRGAGKPDTRMLCICAPSNPLNAVADIAAVARLSRDMGAILAVDDCFYSPALQMPLLLGADIVSHSSTKYLDGQGRVLGGALVGAEELIAPVVAINRSCGPTMSAFNAWVMLKGLETLDLRMRAYLRECAKAGCAVFFKSRPLLRAARPSRSRAGQLPAAWFWRGVGV